MTKQNINTLKIELELSSYDELPEGGSLNAFLDEILGAVTESAHVENVTATIRAVGEGDEKDAKKEMRK